MGDKFKLPPLKVYPPSVPKSFLVDDEQDSTKLEKKKPKKIWNTGFENKSESNSSLVADTPHSPERPDRKPTKLTLVPESSSSDEQVDPHLSEGQKPPPVEEKDPPIDGLDTGSDPQKPNELPDWRKAIYRSIASIAGLTVVGTITGLSAGAATGQLALGGIFGTLAGATTGAALGLCLTVATTWKRCPAPTPASPDASRSRRVDVRRRRMNSKPGQAWARSSSMRSLAMSWMLA